MVVGKEHRLVEGRVWYLVGVVLGIAQQVGKPAQGKGSPVEHLLLMRAGKWV